jgi:VWFA-related protein
MIAPEQAAKICNPVDSNTAPSNLSLNHARISRRSLLSLVLLLPAARFLRAQQQDKTFSVNVKVVNVYATVRDKQRQIVRDLTKDDFKLEEDDHPQTIRYFSKESDLPLTLGLLVDTSASQRRVIDQERSASYKFFDQVLREDKDVAFVIHFDREVELLQDITSSKKLLQSALSQLEVMPPRQMQRRFSPDPWQSGGGSSGGGGTVLYDAILLASDEVMKKQSGRKALVVLSDGVDHGSKVTLADAIASAQRADTLVYSIYFEGEEGGGYYPGYGGRGMGRRGGMGIPRRMPTGGLDGKKILERVSKETGGAIFEVSNKQPLEKTFGEIQDELRNQYSLGYTPDKTDAAPGYRKIRVTVDQKGLVVQARDGYYAD